MLDVQQKEGVEPVSLSVEDPVCEEFYINTWITATASSMKKSELAIVFLDREYNIDSKSEVETGLFKVEKD